MLSIILYSLLGLVMWIIIGFVCFFSDGFVMRNENDVLSKIRDGFLWILYCPSLILMATYVAIATRFGQNKK